MKILYNRIESCSRVNNSSCFPRCDSLVGNVHGPGLTAFTFCCFSYSQETENRRGFSIIIVSAKKSITHTVYMP